jgi:TusE/DsrC/DsvC family sulfur relay protein
MKMPVLDFLEIQGKKIEIDEDGYLKKMHEWDEAVARELAKRLGRGTLTDDTIDVLKFIREHYRKYGFFPILRAVCKRVHKPKDCIIDEFGVPLLAWKLAGLPHPEEPIISLLEAGQSPG